MGFTDDQILWRRGIRFTCRVKDLQSDEELVKVRCASERELSLDVSKNSDVFSSLGYPSRISKIRMLNDVLSPHPYRK